MRYNDGTSNNAKNAAPTTEKTTAGTMPTSGTGTNAGGRRLESSPELAPAAARSRKNDLQRAEARSGWVQQQAERSFNVNVASFGIKPELGAGVESMTKAIRQARALAATEPEVDKHLLAAYLTSKIKKPNAFVEGRYGYGLAGAHVFLGLVSAIASGAPASLEGEAEHKQGWWSVRNLRETISFRGGQKPPMGVWAAVAIHHAAHAKTDTSHCA